MMNVPDFSAESAAGDDAPTLTAQGHGSTVRFVNSIGSESTLKDPCGMLDDPFPRPSDDHCVIEGEFHFRVDGANIIVTTVHLEFWPGGVLVQYGDGVPHVARRGDDAVAFFTSDLAPSLFAATPLPSLGP